MKNMVKHITHEEDLDGTACTVVTRLAYEYVGVIPLKVKGVEASMKDVLEQQFVPLLETGEYNLTLYITDLSIPGLGEYLNDLVEKYKFELIYIDHHETSVPLQKYEWAHVDASMGMQAKSATLLLKEFIYNNKLKELKEQLKITGKGLGDDNGTGRLALLDKFCTLVSDYDTFLFKKNGNTMAEMMNLKFQQLRSISVMELARQIFEKILYNDRDLFEKGEFELFRNMMKDRDCYVNEILATMEIDYFEDYSVGVVFSTEKKYDSELTNRMLEDFALLIDFAVSINLAAGTIRLTSTDDGVDVSAIAKKYGGGGHHNSSGFPIADGYIKEFIIELINKK